MQTLQLLVPGPIDRPSGGSRYDRRIASELRALGWNVAVTELDGAFPQADALARASMTQALAACADAALVLIDGLAGSALPEIVAAQAQRLRLVMLVHLPLADAVDLSEAQRELYFERERRALSAVRGIVVTSRYSAARLADYGVDAARIAVVTPGVDPAPRAHGSGSATPTLLCVAAVSVQKGHDLLIEALASLRDLPWCLRCVGPIDADLPFTMRLWTRIAGLGLKERISFTGALDTQAVDAEYAGADVFVLASRLETYGMVLTEAAVRGLAIVSTRSGGIEYSLPPGAALLVEPGQIEPLASALRQLLSDTSARTALAEAAARAPLSDWTETGRRLAAALARYAA